MVTRVPELSVSLTYTSYLYPILSSFKLKLRGSSVYFLGFQKSRLGLSGLEVYNHRVCAVQRSLHDRIQKAPMGCDGATTAL